MMAFEKLAPCRVAYGPHLLGRADDVREEHGREHSVELRLLRPCPGDEALELGEHRFAIAHKRPVLVSGKLDELRTRDLLCDVHGVLERHELVIGSVHHQRWHPNGWK